MISKRAALARSDPVQGAPAELVHPLIYTQGSIRPLVALFSSRRSSISERTLMWIGLRHGSRPGVSSGDQPTADTN
jgi:hypothetical protein